VLVSCESRASSSLCKTQAVTVKKKRELYTLRILQNSLGGTKLPRFLRPRSELGRRLASILCTSCCNGYAHLHFCRKRSQTVPRNPSLSILEVGFRFTMVLTQFPKAKGRSSPCLMLQEESRLPEDDLLAHGAREIQRQKKNEGKSKRHEINSQHDGNHTKAV
jgi:hypothetical protein